MKFFDFYQQFKNDPLISLSEIYKVNEKFDRKQLNRWSKKGHIKKIRNGFYVFSDKKLNEEYLCLISNKIYKHSYVSMEFALSYYSFIPEGVYTITSVTTEKTNLFESEIATFQYYNIKKDLMYGYELLCLNEINYIFACPEKALLDFLYLKKNIRDKYDMTELRLNMDEIYHKINWNKFNKYLKAFNSKTLNKRVKILKENLIGLTS